MTPELTARQSQFLDYLETEIHRKGRAPSLRNAARHMGVSHAAVAQMLRTLENKGRVRREGRYSRNLHLLKRLGVPDGSGRWREVPVVGRVTAGLPMYAQQEWGGSIVVDSSLYPGQHLFALRVDGDSMREAGILHGDLAICKPRQYARNAEIVVALVHEEEATVKRFFLREDRIELHPENPDYPVMTYSFDEVMVQGKVIGIQRGLEGVTP
ncbi:MAG: transcriptional repressor LexA [Desulfobacterales bacterium]